MTVAMVVSFPSYIPINGIDPSEVYTVVSSANKSLKLAHVRDYSWTEELVD